MKLFSLFAANLVASVAMGIALTIVPWELANSVGGGKFLAFTASWSTAVLIFVSPVAGRLVDRLSRRFALMVCVVTMGIVLQISALAYGSAVLKVAGLSVFYFLSQIFFLFFYNALTAFIQEVFEEEERGKVNGWMQVEMQASTVLVGLLMIYSIESEDFRSVLVLNGFLLFLSALLLGVIPYSKQSRPQQARRSSVVFATILRRYDLVMLGICGSVSFVCIMMLNIVHPVYMVSVLQLDVSALAKLSIAFGIGAAFSGFIAGRCVRKEIALPIMKTCIVLYTAMTFLMALFPDFLVILVLFAGLGATGSAIRVAYNTYIMSVVDEAIFGSYLSVISTVTYIQRTVFGLLLALIIAWWPASNYYWFVFAISFAGFVLLLVHGVLASGHRLEIPELGREKEA
ncbi:hypothetical protein GCM10007094_19390 [Pseudovibrio japonicus]|uniref:Major facilitator superfamily (MFS) profile domain-containing protein n=1 Tax=Pseudovibrio japonicus TaxID=366534 RepID=A0ABQ3E9U5_9HYPH|nr:MFS transporter [Pseudovibrio japonicus]GHB31066.1 hypothetical protein GCM10007094_19390 [Pseudovibrio japonicus]